MSGWSRRRVLTGAAVAAGASLLTGPVAAAAGGGPVLVRRGRPYLTHGVQSGEATAGAATLWARANRPGRMLVEVGDRPDFRGVRLLRGPWLGLDTDFTGRLRVRDLPAGRVHYRVRVEDPWGSASKPVAGSLVVPGRRGGGVRFVWTGDINGQGWGISPELGGMRIFEAMRRCSPDFFLCSGDTVYADGPIPATQPLPDGTPYRSLTSPAKNKVAETLAEFRGQYEYNLRDTHLRNLHAEVAQVNLWDDHEVRNNWYPGQLLDDPRYTEKRVDVLAARGARAFREWLPVTGGPRYARLSFGPLLDLFVLDMRTHKDPNDGNTYADPRRGLLGARQRRWLIDGLRRSRATWKVLATSLPLGLVVPDGPAAHEGVAQSGAGPPRGRELEFAAVLHAVHRARVTGLVLLTADVHYAAAHHYDPGRAAVGDFAPFWEFVAGPANAGAFGPNALDATFGPRAVFVHAPPVANTSPALGYQHFGEVDIDPGSGDLTVRLRDAAGATLWSTVLSADGR